MLGLSFDNDDNFLACSTEGGGISIFKLNAVKEKDSKLEEEHEEEHNEDDLVKMPQQSIWSKLFTRDEGAFASLKVPEKKEIATFASGSYGKNRICVVGSEGKFYLARFDVNVGGMAIKEEEKSLGINQYE